MSTLQNQLKKHIAETAVQYVEKHITAGSVIGIGTGSTVNYFIEAMALNKHHWKGAVSSSEASTARLEGHGIPVFSLNDITALQVYVDGADEITHQGYMIKGGGGALTREKIIASVADKFVCIADASKQVQRLGRFPIPVEVIPMARAAVMRVLQSYFPTCSIAVRRQENGAIYLTDNRCEILDMAGLQLDDPQTVEREINQIVGVVSVGLFVQRPANCLFVNEADAVKLIQFP